MKPTLSEAIIKGCEGTQQCYERLHFLDPDGQQHCCTIGAAAAGSRPEARDIAQLWAELRAGPDLFAVLHELYPELVALAPEAGAMTLERQIIYWNDTERLSREEIAAKVAAVGF